MKTLEIIEAVTTAAVKSPKKSNQIKSCCQEVLIL